METNNDTIEYSQDLVGKYCGDDVYLMRWIDLHYSILYAKAVYYKLVRFGFTPMNDEEYDDMEAEYKQISKQLGKKPEACLLVGWNENPVIEALAMREYNENLYNELKNQLFKIKV